jgi:mannose-6-phosphate isomerase class I
VSYEKFPFIPVPGYGADECATDWRAIGDRLRAPLVVVETYPGVLDEELLPALRQALKPQRVVESRRALLDADAIDRLVEPDLGDDPVFGRLTHLELKDFFDPQRLEQLRREVLSAADGSVLVYGVGASMLAMPKHVLVYADLARWEIQMRQRDGRIGNLGVDNRDAPPSLKYKRGFFVDWRIADRHKRRIFDKVDFFLDTNVSGRPKLAAGEAVRAGLKHATTRPFRVVPFFDPAPWGGQWMKEVCDLDRNVQNFGWCFDCVPEENSLLLAFGEHRFELPAIDLVFQHPRELLGDAVYERFGAEFPIRFDFLDTMDGGNLSLQVHPLTEYIRKQFGMVYTQDESYYLLDAKPAVASVYLGFKENVSTSEFLHALRQVPDVQRFVNKWPAKKHDHFLIPAGTIHCSGRDSMVLEISATPYIFTFKLWDWGRMGLDGKPRPIHLEHGMNSLQFDRTSEWVKRNLINRIEPIATGDGWREERTGLHELEFIETRRHWFTKTTPHDTHGTVNVLNLVEGDEAIVESPTGAFAPFVVHYAETFIVPAAVGEYTIRPHGPAVDKECATIKAFVR